MKTRNTTTRPRTTLPLRQVVVVVVVLAMPLQVFAQGSSEEFWPSAKLKLEFGNRAGIQLIAEKQSGEDVSRTQRKFSVMGSYRFKRVVSVLEEDIDHEKNHNLVLGAGYEYLDTSDAGKIKNEHRFVVQGTPNYSIAPLKLRLQDRNRIEFRLVSGTYSTRYRNKVTVERPFTIEHLAITPYTSGELFYDEQHKDWTENQYAFGLIWPYKKLLSVDTYYLRQNCTTCKEVHVNAVGITVTVFWRWFHKNK